MLAFARKLGLASLAHLAIAGPAMVVTSRAQAANCTTIQRQINFQEGVVPLQIGFDKVSLQVCLNKGNIVSSSVYQELDTGIAGEAAGYNLTEEKSYQVQSSPTLVTWKAPFRGRTCLVKIIPVCGYWEYAEVTVTYYAPNFIGPIPPSNQNRATFRPRCTNKTCNWEFAGGT